MRFLVTLLTVGFSLSASFAQPRPMGLDEYQRALQVISENMRSAENWKTADGAHVLLHYVASSVATEAYANSYRDFCDQTVNDVCRILKINPPEAKLAVYLFPNQVELAKGMHLPQIPPDFRGVSLETWSAFADTGAGPSSLKGTLRSKLSHAMMSSQFGTYNWTVFFDGACTFLEALLSGESWIKQPVPVMGVPMRDLAPLTSVSDRQCREGAAFFGYLLSADKGNPTRVDALFAAMGKARLADLRQPGKVQTLDRINTVFVSVYGENIEALEARWRSGKGLPG